MFEANKSFMLYSFKKTSALLDSSKQPVTSPLYVAGTSFGFEQMVRHCLWKLLSETGFIHNDQLTEMENITLSKLLKKKSALGNGSLAGDMEYAMGILNSAMDKIVCQIKVLQVENQRYHLVVAENCRLKKGINNLEKVSEYDNNFTLPLKMNRSINDIGLSKRTVRILQSLGIDTLEKLGACSLSRLQKKQRIGVKTVHDIETVLSKYLAQASPDR
jgi:hypothetical protein